MSAAEQSKGGENEFAPEVAVVGDIGGNGDAPLGASSGLRGRVIRWRFAQRSGQGQSEYPAREITVIDSALTRPWTLDKRYVRNPNDPQPRWDEFNCPELNQLVPIGKELYTTSADGYLMPVKKNQPPPDLRYFKEAGQ
jgi:hypothetical protein